MTADVFLALRWALATMFFAAAAGKLPDLRGFADAINEYRLLPPRRAYPAAILVIAFELAVATALCVGVQLAAASAAIMLCAFAGAVSVNLLRGRAIDCGCGFGTETPISWRLVARDLALAAISALVFIGPVSALAVPGPATLGLIHASSGVVVQAAPVPMLVVLLILVARLCVSTDVLGFARPGLAQIATLVGLVKPITNSRIVGS